MAYPNLMCLEYDNKRTQASPDFTTAANAEKKTPAQHFSDLFEMQNGQPLSAEQAAYVTGLFNEIFEEANI
jgi:exonuclease SbcD